VSGDGRRLAYLQATARTNLQRVGFDPEREDALGRPSWLTQDLGEQNSPAVSPDGAWLAFKTNTGNQTGLFVMRTDGSNPRPLVNDTHRNHMPRWSPDGGRLSFWSDRSGHYEVWSIGVDGTGATQLTNASGPMVSFPVWAPDGKRIAYMLGGRPFIMNLATPWRASGPQALPAMGGAAEVFVVWSWSPDGKRLAGWSANSTGDVAGVILYSLDTGRFERLTPSGMFPAWLNDSRRLIFADGGRLRIVDSVSGRQREVLSVAPAEVTQPTVSGDGRVIYFAVASSETTLWLATLPNGAPPSR